MLKHKIGSVLGCVLFFAVVACSSDKVIPQGKRVSVLDQMTSVKPEVDSSAKYVKVPKAVKNINWLQADFDAQHKRPNIAAGNDFKKQWSASYGSGSSKRDFLISKPIVDGKTIYTLDAEGELRAFNLTDGEKLWAVELVPNNDNIGDTALKGVGLAKDGKDIFVTTGFGVVVAVKSDDGSKIWETNLHSPLRIAPMVAAGKVFVQSVDNKFYALDRKNGEMLWDYDIAMEDTTMVGGSIAAYCPDLDVVVTGFSNGEIQSFNASIGSPLWSDILVANRQAYLSTYLHTIKASPVIDGENVYVLGSADVLVAIDIRSGLRIWEKEIGGVNTPLSVGNVLYVTSNNNELIALNKENGDVLWATALEIKGKTSEVVVYAPVMLNSQIVVTMSDGHVQTFDPKNGKMLKNIDLDEKLNSAPIAADGYILFSTAGAKLLAYK